MCTAYILERVRRVAAVVLLLLVNGFTHYIIYISCLHSVYVLTSIQVYSIIHDRHRGRNISEIYFCKCRII